MSDLEALELAVTGAPMLELLEGFIRDLREAGLPVSLTENLDAMEAVRHIPLEDREAFKYALAATLVKSNAHWRAFETVFEVYFSLRGQAWDLADADDLGDLDEDADADVDGEMGEQEGAGLRGAGGGDALSPEELAELLYKALLEGDEALLRAIARQAVKRFAGMEPGRPVGGTYYLYRTLRNLDLDGVLDRLVQQSRDDAPADLTPLEERLERDEYEIRIERLKKEVEAEIRRRLVMDRGVEAMAKTLRKPLPEDIDLYRNCVGRFAGELERDIRFYGLATAALVAATLVALALALAASPESTRWLIGAGALVFASTSPLPAVTMRAVRKKKALLDGYADELRKERPARAAVQSVRRFLEGQLQQAGVRAT